MIRRLPALVALVLLTGCGTTGVAMTPTPPSPAASTPAGWPSGRPPLRTTSPLPTGVPAEVSQQRWQAIVDYLADHQISGQPTLVSAEAVTWPDSSLGCPSPGVMYTQALVDGLRVIVTVDGKHYDFRFGGDELKLCSSAR